MRNKLISDVKTNLKNTHQLKKKKKEKQTSKGNYRFLFFLSKKRKNSWTPNFRRCQTTFQGIAIGGVSREKREGRLVFLFVVVSGKEEKDISDLPLSDLSKNHR
jgi:hypothetical protein